MRVGLNRKCELLTRSSLRDKGALSSCSIIKDNFVAVLSGCLQLIERNRDRDILGKCLFRELTLNLTAFSTEFERTLTVRVAKHIDDAAVCINHSHDDVIGMRGYIGSVNGRRSALSALTPTNTALTLTATLAATSTTTLTTSTAAASTTLAAAGALRLRWVLSNT